MYKEQVIGQGLLKKQLLQAIEKEQMPHAQLFVDESGYGGLPLALFLALRLLYSETSLNEKKQLENSSFKLLEHPDLHFVFPVVNLTGKTKTRSEDYLREWMGFLEQNAYGAYTDWYELINAGNKQGAIAVHEVEALHQKMYLKSYLGGNKVCVSWGIDKMNATASNKFLKLLEEPPKKTYFILVAASSASLLPTVISRCQVVELKPIADQDLKNYLMQVEHKEVVLNSTEQLGGSMRNLFNVIHTNSSHDFEALFIHFLRTAFRAKGNKAVVIDLMQWVDEVAVLGREAQKAFLLFAVAFLRNAFLLNYPLEQLVHFESKNNFDLKKLAPFVHAGNFEGLVSVFENAHTYTERNVNAKMLFTDLALQVTRLLNKKA